MYVVVVHSISNPDKFWNLSGFPDTIRLRESLPNAAGTRAVCLFEANSVEGVKDFLDEATRDASVNDYFALAADKAVGLPS